jgi:hypothetical protein
MALEIFCRKHPKYKAERPPTSRPICMACKFLFLIASRVRQREYAHAFKFKRGDV